MRIIWHLSLIFLVQTQGIDLDLDNTASVKNACHAIAKNMLSHYTGYKPGDVPGNLPDPYYWWEAGAMFNALIDYWFYTGDSQWNDITAQALIWQAGDLGSFMPANQTRTEGNDDQGFWAFAAMSAAERNFPMPPRQSKGREPDWLAMAQATFNTQAWRWDTENCGGGLRWQIFTWNAGYMYKNTISNGCFFNLAARLARYTGNQSYADWAARVWDWTHAIGFMTDDYSFYDGASVDGNCTHFDHVQWTYNAGVYLLGAAAMYNYTHGDPLWKQRTEGIINAAHIFFADSLASKDIMYERACEPVDTCKVDQRSFKGFLARWMAASTQFAPFAYDMVMPRLRSSALAAAKTCAGGTDGAECSLKWTEQKYTGGPQGGDVGIQMAALEVIQSTLIRKIEPPVTQEDGGRSKGNPGGGSEPPVPMPALVVSEIGTGDRVGAALVTIVLAGWVIYSPGPDFTIKVEEVPVPQLGMYLPVHLPPFAFAASGFNLTSDLHYTLDDLGISMNNFGVRSPGHEGAGVAVKVGENVANFKLGDRAGIKPMMDTCGACTRCWSDKETYCAAAMYTGLMVPGTYQQYIVSPARYATPIPEGIPDEIAAPIMCSASTMYRSLVESRLQPGGWAVFPGGGGGVGIQGVQLASAMGMRPVVVDTGEAKRNLALEMGAEAFVDFKTVPDAAAAVIEVADGIGGHGVFVTAQAAYPTALSYLGTRIGGAVMCIGIAPAGTMSIPVDPNLLLFRNTRIRGTLVGSRYDTIKALDFARRGKLKQICEVWPVERLPEAVDRLRKSEMAENDNTGKERIYLDSDVVQNVDYKNTE
ncbi:glycosyl hydrolase family 76-domain-containing protein [Aspergillus desertorum]